MMNTTSKIGDIVAADYRSASVFKKYGIDFCCGGGKELESVCKEKTIDMHELLAELEVIQMKKPLQADSFQSWPLDKLVDHIVTQHHGYVKRATEDLKQYLGKVAKVHGNHNPELLPIHENFQLLAQELAAHMQKEELILFPYIEKMVSNREAGSKMPPPMFGTIQNPIKMMEEEHTGAGNFMAEIRTLSGQYTPPEHACNTYMVSFKMLEEFESDLHMHIHLENNILFPKAIEMEKELLTDQH